MIALRTDMAINFFVAAAQAIAKAGAGGSGIVIANAKPLEIGAEQL